MRILEKFPLLILTIFFSINSLSAQIYIVNTNDDLDDGFCDNQHCSLREAINASNFDQGSSSILFDIAGSGPHTINVGSQLPDIWDFGTIIDGTSQPGWIHGDIIIDGNNSVTDGIKTLGDQTVILGLQIQNFTGNGIVISSFNGPNFDSRIGAAGAGNIIISNGTGIQNSNVLYGTIIQGNYIGTDLSSANLGNTNSGMNFQFVGNTNIIIGGSPTLGEGNIIGFNGGYGIGGALGNAWIEGNYIGTDYTTYNQLPNNSDGIRGTSPNTLITNNAIAYNTQYGVRINCGTCGPITVQNNSIYCNILGGIGDSYGTPKPSITDRIGDKIIGTAQPFDVIQVFEEDYACNPCQGKTFLGSVTADSNGDWELISGVYEINSLTATATTGAGATSAFSNCFSYDECSGAVTLEMNLTDCIYDITRLNTDGNTVSSNPLYDCSAFAANGPTDIWAKAIVPSTGNMMVELLDGAFIDPMVEVYSGTCGSLNFKKCDSLFSYPNQFPIENQTPGNEIFLRIFDKYDVNLGSFDIGVRALDSNPSNWVICDSALENHVANEFLVQYEPNATAAEIQAVENDIIAQGGVMLDECDCSERVIQRWEEPNPIEVEERVKSTRNKSKVDTVDYNIIIDDNQCYEDNSYSVTIFYPGPFGQPGEIGFQFITVYDPVDCEQSGIYETLPTNPYSPIGTNYPVNVAIIDSGVDDGHPYITNGIWQNPEANDGDNCQLNDVIGYDFYNDDGDPDDVDGHGTLVNGVVAGNFTNDANLNMINTKFYETGKSTLFDATCAIYYAIENGASVINLSWGFYASDGIPKILEDALAYAKTKDILLVTSSGNTAIDNDNFGKFPSNYDEDNVIAVAAYEQLSPGVDPTLSEYSNFGVNSVDIAAIGYIETTTVMNGRDTLSGTSLAAPVVTRTASEIRARYPMLSANEVRDCILNSADVYASLADKVSSSGILNHTAALNCAYNTALAKCNNVDVYLSATHAIDTTVLTNQRIFSDAFVPSANDVNYKALTSIELQNNFEVAQGAEFLAIIEGCSGTILPPFAPEGDDKMYITQDDENVLLHFYLDEEDEISTLILKDKNSGTEHQLVKDEVFKAGWHFAVFKHLGNVNQSYDVILKAKAHNFSDKVIHITN